MIGYRFLNLEANTKVCLFLIYVFKSGFNILLLRSHTELRQSATCFDLWHLCLRKWNYVPNSNIFFCLSVYNKELLLVELFLFLVIGVKFSSPSWSDACLSDIWLVVSFLHESAQFLCLAFHFINILAPLSECLVANVSQDLKGVLCFANNNQPEGLHYPNQYFRWSFSFWSKCTMLRHSIDGKLILLLPGSLWLPVQTLCNLGCLCANWDFRQKEKKETFICVTVATRVCLQPIHLSCPCVIIHSWRNCFTQASSCEHQCLQTSSFPTEKSWNA